MFQIFKSYFYYINRDLVDLVLKWEGCENVKSDTLLYIANN